VAGALARQSADDVPVMTLVLEQPEYVARYLAAIVESSSDAIIGTTLDGIIATWNQGAEHLYGYSREEAIGQHVRMLIPEDRRHESPANAARISRGERVEPFETVRVHKDGTPIDVSLAMSPIADSGGQIVGLASVTRDISERRRASEALRERELQYRTIFEASSDGLVITDADTGIVLEANPAMCRMHGYSVDEFIGKNRAEFIHPESQHPIDDQRRTLRSGEAYRLRAVDVRKDGSLLHVEVHGTRILFHGVPAILTVVRDITSDVQSRDLLEQRVAERTRELSTLLDISRNVASTLELTPLLELILDQLRTVIDYTGTAILTIEGDDLVIVGQRGPLSDEDARLIRHPVAGLAPVWDRLCRGEAVVCHDVRGDSHEAQVFRSVSGAELDDHYSFIGSCLWAPLVVKNQLIGIMSVATSDVNAFDAGQIEMAAAIARQAAVAIENARLFQQAQGKAALEERQKLARELHDSVSQALYGIALGAQTVRQLLDRDPAKAVEPTEYVLSLADAGLAEMRALIFELRPESLQTEGLVEALRKQAAALRARYGIAMTVDLGSEPEIALDAKEALYRIAQEALHNTMKHARATEATLCLASDGDGVILEIADNGCGFDPNGSFPGHLGLTSMRERITRIGGTLEITSSPGAGTRLRATLLG
jgi:PAS domain S-box-containing protein